MDPVLAGFYFVAFNILFIFVLANLFLAIMNQAYHQPQSSQDEDVNIKRSLLCCLRRKGKAEAQKGSD